ncbi:MAG: hypothetical protein JXB03_04705 [Spirochaetales bacterium]|nr:hypothetical protein [Spirochaetales bacterium]
MDLRKRLNRSYLGASDTTDDTGTSFTPDPANTPDGAPQSISKPQYARFDIPRTSLKAVVEGHTSRGYRKAAKLMVMLGREDAARILEHFSKEEVEHILTEVAGIKRVEDVEAESLLHEFGLIKTTVPVLKGGKDVARDLLLKAFGAEEGTEMFRRIIPYEGEKPFQFLFDLDPQQIYILLKKDPVPVTAMVIAHLPPQTAGRVLKYFNPVQRKEFVKRIARLGKIDPDVISNTEELLKERLRTQGKIVVQEIDGKGRLAQILKHMPVSREDSILNAIEEADPLLSKELKDRVYTVDMAFQLPKRDLSLVLREMENDELALLLAGRGDDFRAHVLNHVSQRRRELIQAELSYLGTPAPKDTDRAAREFIDIMLEMREEGRISLSDEYL